MLMVVGINLRRLFQIQQERNRNGGIDFPKELLRQSLNLARTPTTRIFMRSNGVLNYGQHARVSGQIATT